MYKILFVCLGNICRSPAADGVMRKLTEQCGVSECFEIDSAGIGSWHTGQLPDRRMRQCGALHGYVFDHRARQVKSLDFECFDYILGMDEDNMFDLRQLKSQYDAGNAHASKAKLLCLADFLRRHPGQKSIPDPYYGSQSDFEFALQLIEDACEGLIDTLSPELP